MRIVQVDRKVFGHETNTRIDSDGHEHPGSPRRTTRALLTITATDGTKGELIVSPGDVTEELLARFVRPMLIDADPMRPEHLWFKLYRWQRGSGGKLTDRVLCAVELALWDLIGKATGQPVWKLLGGYRERIPAYGSTMCGDDMENGLATPDDYARFAQDLVKKRKYKAIKLHTWMPPVAGAPDVKMDYAACAAVREAVGPAIPLMLDPNHWYSRTDSLWLARRLEELDFLWMEECMEEASQQSYRWLTGNLHKLNILGPESMAGKYWTRAEWATSGACDMIRAGVWDVGGISPALKCARIAEGFGMSCEVHGTGVGNMAVCGAIPNTTYYERGLLHPFVDYDEPPDYLNRIDDEMDDDGCVLLRNEAGLGQDVNHEHIDDNLV